MEVASPSTRNATLEEGVNCKVRDAYYQECGVE
jgi:hypothetical protein